MSQTNGAAHIGRETTTTALGREWTFARCGRDTWHLIAQEARRQLPDPIDTMLAKIDKASLKDAETLRGLRVNDALAFAEWEKRKQENPNTAGPQPPPMELAYKPLADFLATNATEASRMYLGFQSVELNSWIMSFPGLSYVLYLLLKPNHPDATPDLAYDLIFELGMEEAKRVLETTRGKLREKRPNDEAPAA